MEGWVSVEQNRSIGRARDYSSIISLYSHYPSIRGRMQDYSFRSFFIFPQIAIIRLKKHKWRGNRFELFDPVLPCFVEQVQFFLFSFARWDHLRHNCGSSYLSCGLSFTDTGRLPYQQSVNPRCCCNINFTQFVNISNQPALSSAIPGKQPRCDFGGCL